MRQLKKAKRYKTNSFNRCATIYNQTVVLSFTMKLLLLVLVLLFCFLSNVNGLKCYECTNPTILDDCKQTKVTTCGLLTSQKYCVKADFERIDRDPFRYCNGNCTIKGCLREDFKEFCESGSYDISEVLDDMKGTVYCCEGNLCNSANKVYNKNINDKTLRNQTIISTTTVSLLNSTSLGTTTVSMLSNRSLGTTNSTTSVSLLDSRFSEATNSTTTVSFLQSRSLGTKIVKNSLFYAILFVCTLSCLESFLI